MSRSGTSPSAVRVVTYQSCPSSARLRSMSPCTQKQPTASASDSSTITRTSRRGCAACPFTLRASAETSLGSGMGRALLVVGLAAHDVAEGKPAERDALDARDAEARWDQREQPGEIERVQVPLVVHALRHLIIAGARAQQHAIQTALSEHRLQPVDQPLVRHRDDRDTPARDDPVHLGERSGRRREMLEHFRAVDTLPRAISKRQVFRVALHEGAMPFEAACRLREERLGDIHPEALRGRNLREDVPGATSDLQDSIAEPRGEQGEDASDALALDVPDQGARMVVKLLDVVLLDHRIVPRLELAQAAEGARTHCRTTCRRVLATSRE